MSCACGNCPDPAQEAAVAQEAAPGEVHLQGRLICPSADDLGLVLAALPEHMRLTRAEPGCIAFRVEQDADAPLIFHVQERFRDQEAFDAHQARVRTSDWGRLSAHIPRDFVITSV